MDAYRLLGINSEKFNSNEVDLIIKKSIEDILYLRINKIKELLDSSIDSKKTLESIDIIVNELLCYLIAYECIKSYDQRNIYDFNGRIDVFLIVENKQIKLNTMVKFHIGNLTASNAYQILSLDSEYLDQNDDTDEKIRNKMLEKLKLLLSNMQIINFNEDKDLVIKLIKYNWAYKSLKDSEHRRDYMKRVYIQNIKDKMTIVKQNTYQSIKHIRKAVLKKLKEKPSCIIKDGDNFFLEITEEAKFIPIDLACEQIKEKALKKYKITRWRNSQKIKTTIIFSNIDIRRLQIDLEYQELVKSKLLNESMINLARENMYGYVGELDDNDSLVFDEENFAILFKFLKPIIRSKRRELLKKYKDNN